MTKPGLHDNLACMKQPCANTCYIVYVTSVEALLPVCCRCWRMPQVQRFLLENDETAKLRQRQALVDLEGFSLYQETSLQGVFGVSTIQPCICQPFSHFCHTYCLSHEYRSGWRRTQAWRERSG
jgi:hypothetical protein